MARKWSNGDIVTASNLNDIEQGVAGVDIDLGYSCTEEWVTLTDESVTTVTSEDSPAASASLAYTDAIKADSIKVTFDGTEYTCQKNGDGGYGAPWNDETQSMDWSTYPFSIAYADAMNTNMLATETAGTHQIKIEEFKETVETSECFEKAVAINLGYLCDSSNNLKRNLFQGAVKVENVGVGAPSGAFQPLIMLFGMPLSIGFAKVGETTVWYDVELNADGSYGASWDEAALSPDWSTYPFSIRSAPTKGYNLYTENAGNYRLSIMVDSFELTMSTCFISAVLAVAESRFHPLVLDVSNSTLNRSFGAIATAYRNGRAVILDPVGSIKSYHALQTLEVNDGLGATSSGGTITFADGSVWEASHDYDYPTLRTSTT